MRSMLRVIRSLPTGPPPSSMTLVVLSATLPQTCFLVCSVKPCAPRRFVGSAGQPPLCSGRRQHDAGEETGVLQGCGPDTVRGLIVAATACVDGSLHDDRTTGPLQDRLARRPNLRR
jgi:hypothetical protein